MIISAISRITTATNFSFAVVRTFHTAPHSHYTPPPLQILSPLESIDLFLSSLRFLRPLRAPVLFNLQHNGLPLYPSVRPRNCKRLEGKLQCDADQWLTHSEKIGARELFYVMMLCQLQSKAVTASLIKWLE